MGKLLKFFLIIIIVSSICIITLKAFSIYQNNNITPPNPTVSPYQSKSSVLFNSPSPYTGKISPDIILSTPAKLEYSNDPVKNLKKGLVPMVVTMENDKTLGIYSKLPDDKMLLTKFTKKPWGTWNIGGWYIITDDKIPSKKHYSLADGSSDWEYVFRVSKNHSGGYEFSGGNHENEILKSLKFFKNGKETELFLQEGEKHYISNLKIVEETYLTTNNSPSEKYAQVVRTYSFSPSKITLDTNFDFISDIYMGTSYVCMMPTNKSFARHIKFLDSKNTYSTPEPGNTLTTSEFENYIGKEKTMSVKLWGDSNPSYSFLVGIGNKKMVDYFNNNLKVFLWDLNEKANKLYFSKYDNQDFTLVEKGTEWNNSSYWKLMVEH
ncbi:hypothetical protein RBH29_13240 [Herbivorax sp. ANBcel31]|uniref:hypothetical protein n=1 Tax=Herbivorax sp. ANBcel31 TaxID=3069754 RepID=UPI0027B17857|nr:hypothetical protein [Herbivorax sp. ANBcel31]MDQ2087390.1 hypothetical protein [Herbivorax sp. ANBcel31]